MTDPTDLLRRLHSACIGGCSCETKHPKPDLHDDNCRYRLFTESAQAITDLTAQRDLARGMAIAEAAKRVDDYATQISRDRDAFESDTTLSDWNRSSIATELRHQDSAVRIAAEYVRRLSPTLNLDALVEKAAGAIYDIEKLAFYEPGPDYAAISEFAKRMRRDKARAVLAALGIGTPAT